MRSLLLLLVLSIFIVQTKCSSDILCTDVFFLSDEYEKRSGDFYNSKMSMSTTENARGRDVIHVEAKSVKSLTNDTNIRNTGFMFGSSTRETIEFTETLHDTCFATKEETDIELKSRECLDRFISEHKTLVSDFLESLPGEECSEDFVLFARTSTNPQNLHYDTVKFETKSCEDIVPNANEQTVYLRHWLPLIQVMSAPLLLSNTTLLYDNACDRRFSDTLENQSPSWLIPTKDDFLKRCDKRQQENEIFRETCTWYHTLGMSPGEYVSFRNGMVLHGSAPVLERRVGEEEEEEEEETLRLSLAVDCILRIS